MASLRFESLILSTQLQFLFLIITTNTIFTNSQALNPPDFINNLCPNGEGNFAGNSTYKTNLDELLRFLTTTNGNGYGFFNSSAGENDGRASVIGLCRADVGASACISCLTDAKYRLTQNCHYSKEAIAWYDDCMLRYTSRQIYGILDPQKDDNPVYYLGGHNASSAAHAAAINQTVTKLFGRLIINQTAGGGDLRKFGTGNASVAGYNQTLYGLAQCTPDLSEVDCRRCLNICLAGVIRWSFGREWARVTGANCRLDYWNQTFFDLAAVTPLPSPPASPPLVPASPVAAPPPPPPLPGGSNAVRTVIITVVAVVVSLMISICIYMRVRKTKKRLQEHDMEDAEALQLNFHSISVATDNFSEANKLGRGGFGAVYKGRLVNQEEIAVKRLSKDSSQGDIEFKNEVLLVAKLQHRNLVRLLGFCLEGTERLLVYEYVPNASLDHFIFDPTKRGHMDWDSRYKIILGIGRGLLYLHEDSRLRIIHRDLKASNILLDSEMKPKIADFGMARLFEIDQTQGETNRVVGTYGYMAPEYVLRGHFSVKSDVYSFGVLVLEIVSGQKNSSFRHGEGNVEDLLSYAWKSWKEGTASDIIDPMLGSGSRAEMMMCIHIGLLCVQQNLADRPTMAAVVHMLTSSSALNLPEPAQPAFFMFNGIVESSYEMSLASKGCDSSTSGVTGSTDRSKPHSGQTLLNQSTSITRYSA